MNKKVGAEALGILSFNLAITQYDLSVTLYKQIGVSAPHRPDANSLTATNDYFHSRYLSQIWAHHELAD